MHRARERLKSHSRGRGGTGFLSKFYPVNFSTEYPFPLDDSTSD